LFGCDGNSGLHLPSDAEYRLGGKCEGSYRESKYSLLANGEGPLVTLEREISDCGNPGSPVSRSVAVRDLFVMQDIFGNLVMVG
jgi:hypothetical protein